MSAPRPLYAPPCLNGLLRAPRLGLIALQNALSCLFSARFRPLFSSPCYIFPSNSRLNVSPMLHECYTNVTFRFSSSRAQSPVTRCESVEPRFPVFHISFYPPYMAMGRTIRRKKISSAPVRIRLERERNRAISECCGRNLILRSLQT